MSLYQFTYSSKLKLLLLLFIIYCFCFYKFINWPPNRISEVDITSDSPSYERINEGSKRQPQKLFTVASVFSVKFSNTPHHSFFKNLPLLSFHDWPIYENENSKEETNFLLPWVIDDFRIQRKLLLVVSIISSS